MEFRLLFTWICFLIFQPMSCFYNINSTKLRSFFILSISYCPRKNIELKLISLFIYSKIKLGLYYLWNDTNIIIFGSNRGLQFNIYLMEDQSNMSDGGPWPCGQGFSYRLKKALSDKHRSDGSMFGYRTVTFGCKSTRYGSMFWCSSQFLEEHHIKVFRILWKDSDLLRSIIRTIARVFKVSKANRFDLWSSGSKIVKKLKNHHSLKLFCNVFN